MKANLRKKKLLPLSRATWSVLHDRHYFHHHRHRPHNYNLFEGEGQHSVQSKRLPSTYLPILRNICAWSEESSLSQHKTSQQSGLRLQRTAYFPRRRNTSQRHNTIECNNQSSALTKSSRSSHDPGARVVFSILSHLQLSSHLRDTPTYRYEGVTSSERVRYMCGQSSYCRCRSSTDANRNSDLSFQPVSRFGLTSIPFTRNLEVAQRA